MDPLLGWFYRPALTAVLWVVVHQSCGWCYLSVLVCDALLLLAAPPCCVRKQQLCLQTGCCWRWGESGSVIQILSISLNDYYPSDLWVVSLLTENTASDGLVGCVEAQTVALGYDAGGDGSDGSNGSRVYEAYCWKMDSSMIGCVWGKCKDLKDWIAACQRRDEWEAIRLNFAFI